ncbi:MAG: SurA N-terminal domain-containing protein, partial [Candidatus Hydrogenedentota bacterium]
MKMKLVIAQAIVGVTALIGFAGCGRSAPPAPDEAASPVPAETTEKAPSVDMSAAPPAPSSDVEKFVNDVAKDEDIPEIVAKVGDITVTREQYIDAMKSMQRLQAAGSIMKQDATERRAELQPLNSAQKQKILDAYIDGRIIERLIEREGITASDEEVEQRMREGRENLMTEENYQEYLKWSQTDEGKLKDQVRRQIAQEKYRVMFGKDCTVTDTEVSDEYGRQVVLGKMDYKAGVDFWQVLKRVAPG